MIVHQMAVARMKELVLQVIQLLNVENSELQFAPAYEALGKLGEFIAKAFGQWLQEDRARLYAFDAIEHALKTSGHMPASGRLAALTREQREQIADQVCAMWAKIPVTYQFVFPLPLVGEVDEVIEITPGIVIKNSPRDTVDEVGIVAVKGFLDTWLVVMNSVRRPAVGSERSSRGAVALAT